MSASNQNLGGFYANLFVMVITFGLFAAAFAAYVRANNQIYLAQEKRLSSILLADELRHSSDDLTRMVRTYIVTGDPWYKSRFREILDIRDGRQPRPVAYHDIYWDLVSADDKRPRAFGVPVPLLELMRQAGFNDAEFAKLEEAKAKSDWLTNFEFKAMALIESGAVDDASRIEASRMLHDRVYHQAKMEIMQPISEFTRMSEQRTIEAVRAAESRARFLLLAVLCLGLIQLFLLWRIRRDFSATLGGSLRDIYRHIADLGRGKHCVPIEVPKASEDSVLGWVSETQNRLARIDQEREAAAQAIKASEQRFRDMVNSTDGIVWEADARTFTFTFISKKAVSVLGFSETDWHQPGFWVEHLHPEDKTWAPDYCAACTGRLEPHDFEYRFIAKDGRTVWLRDLVTVVADKHGPRWLRGVMIDITKQKELEKAQQENSATFQKLFEESSNAIILANSAGLFVECNRAAIDLLRTTKESLLGNSLERISPQFQSDGRRSEEAAQEAIELANRNGLHRCDWTFVDAEGKEIIADFSFMPIVINGKNLLHMTWRDITERKASEEKIAHLAFYDPLTDLPNRRLLIDRLNQALASSARHGRHGALMLVDMDNFKALNDTQGHDAGDRLLVEVAHRLKGCVRDGDTVARLGGDEFVVILNDLSEEQLAAVQAERIAEKILSVLGEPYWLKNSTEAPDDLRDYRCTSSIGIALFIDNSVSLDTLLKRADTAMYQAKATGRNTLCFFDQVKSAELSSGDVADS